MNFLYLIYPSYSYTKLISDYPKIIIVICRLEPWREMNEPTKTRYMQQIKTMLA